MNINKKLVSNIFYGVLIALLIYPKTRAVFLRVLSFSPSVEKVEERVQVTNFNWQLAGINTQNLDFNDLKGRVILVNFWATWCVPCVAEMPSIETLYQDYGDKVSFVLVTTDAPAVVLPFLEKKNFTLPVYNARTMHPAEFNTKSIPRSFLVDKSGTIVIDAARADWDTKKTRKLLDELLND